MDKSNIANGIPADVIALLEKNLGDCRKAIDPYVITLTPEERKKSYKVADGTEPFVEKGIIYAKQFPQFIPKQLNAEEMNIFYSVMVALAPVVSLATDLLSVLSDTHMVAGCETLQDVLCYYNSLKQAAAENVPSAKEPHENMKKRYEKKKRKEQPVIKGLGIDGEQKAS